MNLSSVTDHLVGPAAFASVIFVLAQLRQSVNQEIRQLIAEYNMRYLQIAARIPYEILVENIDFDSLPVEKQADTKRALYDYFLLCEEQLTLVNGRTFKRNSFMHRLSRLGTRVQIRDVRVWEQAEREWIDGINENIKRIAIQDAFHDISRRLKPDRPEDAFTTIRKNISSELLTSR
jgi:SAM-dependent MidA family methyltransferase